MTISVVLATRNEEENLPRCLESIKDIADEIIIADEHSIDATVNIAKKYNAHVILVDHQSNFHINKNIAIKAAKMDWVLQLDADEVVSPELAKEILETISTTNKSGFWINRLNWFLTTFLTKGGQYPDPTLRLYRRGFGILPANDVHEQAVVKGEVGILKNNLLHYRDTTFEKYLSGFNRYSSFMVSSLKNTNVKINILTIFNYLVLKPIYIFLNIYIRHRGYVDGKPGFIFALFSGWVPTVAFIKYWQIEKI